MILKFYKTPGLKCGHLGKKFNSVSRVTDVIADLETEICYYIETETEFDKKEVDLIKWILTSPFELEELKEKSIFETEDFKKTILIEIGPRSVKKNRIIFFSNFSFFFICNLFIYRLNFSTPFSSNAVSICKSVHLDKVKRIEVSTRYLVRLRSAIDKNIENEVRHFFYINKLYIIFGEKIRINSD